MSFEEKTFEVEGKEYGRDTLWRTYDGRELPIRELEDTHILNLLNYIGRRVDKSKKALDELDSSEVLGYGYREHRLLGNKAMLNVIKQEIAIRDLDVSRVAGGKNLPFKKDGNWMIWKEGDRLPTQIPNSIDFIKPIGEE